MTRAHAGAQPCITHLPTSSHLPHTCLWGPVSPPSGWPAPLSVQTCKTETGPLLTPPFPPPQSSTRHVPALLLSPPTHPHLEARELAFQMQIHHSSPWIKPSKGRPQNRPGPSGHTAHLQPLPHAPSMPCAVPCLHLADSDTSAGACAPQRPSLTPACTRGTCLVCSPHPPSPLNTVASLVQWLSGQCLSPPLNCKRDKGWDQDQRHHLQGPGQNKKHRALYSKVTKHL